jgi:hypothetical protein
MALQIARSLNRITVAESAGPQGRSAYKVTACRPVPVQIGTARHSLTTT